MRIRVLRTYTEAASYLATPTGFVFDRPLGAAVKHALLLIPVLLAAEVQRSEVAPDSKMFDLDTGAEATR